MSIGVHLTPTVARENYTRLLHCAVLKDTAQVVTTLETMKGNLVRVFELFQQDMTH